MDAHDILGQGNDRREMSLTINLESGHKKDKQAVEKARALKSSAGPVPTLMCPALL